MQILHRTDSTRLVCTGADALRRAFGQVWEMVARALTVLFTAANLDEVAKMACVRLRRVAGATRHAIQFVVEHGCVEISFEGIGAGAAGRGSEEQSTFQQIRMIIIDSIIVTAPVPVR